MQTSLLPKEFTFTEADRDGVALSDSTKIQLNSATSSIELVPSAAGEYPLDADLYVVTKLTTPGAWLKWYMLLIGVTHGRDGDDVKTTYRVRLHNGTNHYYWNGAAWVVAGASNWNTEAEVNAHIATFSHKSLRVVVNLATTDKHYTPTLAWVKVAWEGRIYFLEDIIYRSLVPALRTIRSITDYPLVMDAATSSIDLNTYPMDAGYKVTSIDSVFDHTADPDHFTDLLSGYNPATKVITLSAAVPAGHTVWIRCVYAPNVVVIQSVDYAELASVPALVVENLREEGSVPRAATDGVYDAATLRGVLFQPPYATNLRLDIIAMSPSGVDALRLQEDVMRFCENNQLLTSKGLDEQYRFHLDGEFTDTSSAEFSGLRTGKASARVLEVLSYLRPAKTGPEVTPTKRIRVQGDVETDINVG